VEGIPNLPVAVLELRDAQQPVTLKGGLRSAAAVDPPGNSKNSGAEKPPSSHPSPSSHRSPPQPEPFDRIVAVGRYGRPGEVGREARRTLSAPSNHLFATLSRHTSWGSMGEEMTKVSSIGGGVTHRVGCSGRAGRPLA
jgi:hypothetical protein